MVEGGRRGEVSSPPKPIVGSKRSCPEIFFNSNSEYGSGGMWWWVGRDGGTSPRKLMPGLERSHPERNKTTGLDGKSIEMLG